MEKTKSLGAIWKDLQKQTYFNDQISLWSIYERGARPPIVYLAKWLEDCFNTPLCKPCKDTKVMTFGWPFPNKLPCPHCRT